MTVSTQCTGGENHKKTPVADAQQGLIESYEGDLLMS
jgi:hypothetical protein